MSVWLIAFQTSKVQQQNVDTKTASSPSAKIAQVSFQTAPSTDVSPPAKIAQVSFQEVN